MNISLDQDIKPPHPIAVEFFSRQSNKTTRLVNSADGFSIEGSHRWYEFNFVEPIYITKIEIISTGYATWNKFEVDVSHIDGTSHNENISVTDNSVTLALGKLANGFKFKPDTRWASSTEITRVVVTGYNLSEFHALEWEVKDLREAKRKLDQRQEEKSELDAKVEDQQKTFKSLQAEVGKLTAQREQLEEAIQLAAESILEKQASEKDIQSEIESLQEERRKLRAEIATDESTLDNLSRKIRLFPTHLAGFVEQGDKNIRSYLLIGVPFAAIFFVILWSLFTSAIDLTQLWRNEEDIDIWTIFLTRIPFVFVAIALVEACGFVVGRLVFEIVKINRQRLDFQKLSIIAKDVVTASASSTAMSEEELFAEETKLKMALLQEHMQARSQEEFKYSGSAISSALIGVATRFAGSK